MAAEEIDPSFVCFNRQHEAAEVADSAADAARAARVSVLLLSGINYQLGAFSGELNTSFALVKIEAGLFLASAAHIPLVSSC